jgi:hypothetical protein
MSSEPVEPPPPSGPTIRPRIVGLAWGAVGAQVLFIGAWLLVGALEGHGYSPGRHDISDLGALTAHRPWVLLPAEGAAGLATMAFALGALRPALAVPGRGPALGAWLVALSLPALDNVGDLVFRLDCRAADAGCSASEAATSWHGKAHVVVFLVAVVPTALAPYLLARRMALVEGWRDLARPTRSFGALVVGGLLADAVLTDTAFDGWAQRTLIVFVCAGVVALARRVVGRAGSAPDRRGGAPTHARV